MSGIVHVRHPAPVRHVARAGSRERLSYVTVSTPVRLPEAAPGDVEYAALYVAEGYGEGIELYAHGGALWTKLALIGRHGFLELVSDPRFDDRKKLYGTAAWFQFVNSPLFGANQHILQVGDGKDPLRAGRVVDDGRGQAAGDLVRFLEDNVRLAGEDVLVRLPGPLLCINLATMDKADVPYPRNWRTSTPDASGGFLVRPDRLTDLYDVLRLGKVFSPSGPVLPGGMERDFLRDDDIALMANEMPQRVLRQVDAVARMGFDGEEAERLKEARDAMLPWLGRGLMGAIPVEEAEAVLTQALAGLRTVDAVRGETSAARAYLTGYIETVAVPRLREAAMPEEDLEALGGLGPGGMR